MQYPLLHNKWALILGASSGFGEATALALAQAGMHIFGIHLDRKATMPHVEEIQETIKSQYDRKAVFFNVDASHQQDRNSVISSIKETLDHQKQDDTIKVLLHSLAFGSLRPYINSDSSKTMQVRQMQMTLEVMAHSLVFWTQELIDGDLLRQGAKIFSMTSAGSHRIWPDYGAVSAAKAALESHTRQLAMELAPKRIAVNCIQAGVTDTPSLRKIPNHVEMIRYCLERNPSGRLTTPKDITEVIVALSSIQNHWVTGNIVVADGGEDLIG